MRGTLSFAVALSIVSLFPSLSYAQSAAPTYSKDIAPIFYAQCTSCHRAGEIAPMSLMTYKEARPWARSIAAKVADGTMPPWHADPKVGQFSNERRLTDAQKSTIQAWVAAGAPEGNPTDLPEPPKYADGWRIGTPDAILSMQEDYPLPATGTIPYLYFEVPTNFTEDRWVQAWELRPGNRAAVHHVIVYTRPPQSAQPQQAQARPADGAPRPQPLITFAEGMEIPAGQTGGPPLPDGPKISLGPLDRPRPRGTGGSIGGYVPGNSTRSFPEGTAMRVPAGSTLVFQMHYTTTGQATTDRTKMGMIFAKTPPRIALNGGALINGGLHIPAGAADHRIDAEMTFNRDVVLYSMTPHTHVRGKRWSYDVIYPDGRTQTILSVPNYDFEWQHEYIFREPIRLPSGTKMHASAWYDNSTGNKSNPDPKKDVWWGDQTWEEMMFTGLTFSVVGAPSPASQQ